MIDKKEFFKIIILFVFLLFLLLVKKKLRSNFTIEIDHNKINKYGNYLLRTTVRGFIYKKQR